MIFSQDQRDTLLRALSDTDNGFLLCAFPGSDTFTLYCGTGVSGTGFQHGAIDKVVISSFDGAVEMLVSRSEIEELPLYDTTSKADYVKGFSRIVNRLKSDGGKTVYSRVIKGTSRLEIWEIAERLFNSFPDAFRFILRVGEWIWVGASPELLIDNDTHSGKLHTVALAGTRESGPNERAWDIKNKEEHGMVVDFIVDVLDEFGLSPIAGPTNTSRYGVIEHLMTGIDAIAADTCNLRRLMSRLSPTPALSGLPRDKAMSDIRLAEAHRRGLYGGFIAIDRGEGRTTAYVNLRSARLRKNSAGGYDFNVFVGGGLTSRSECESEWRETEQKSLILLNSLEA